MKSTIKVLLVLLSYATFLISQEFDDGIYSVYPQEGYSFLKTDDDNEECTYKVHVNTLDQQKKGSASINLDQLDFTLSSESEPLVTVANCVNLVSGTFFQVDKDLTSKSIEPLELVRFYDSSNCTESFLGFGFGVQYPLWASDVIEGSRHYYGMISERDGYLIPYQIKANTTHSVEHPFKIDPRLMERGYTNLNRSVIKGSANFINWQAYFRSKKGALSSWTIQLGDGSIRIYDKWIKLDRKTRNRMNFPTKNGCLLTKEIKPNGNQILYSYKTISEMPCLSKITSYNRTKTILFDELNFSYSQDTCTISNRGGESVTYAYSNQDCLIEDLLNGTIVVNRKMLQKVKSSKNGQIFYKSRRKKTHRKVVHIKKPGGNFLEVHYLDNTTSKKHDKVASLSSPVGPNGETVTTYKFVYGKDLTTVFNALGEIEIYRFDKNNRLIEKMYMEKKDSQIGLHALDNANVLRQDVYGWSETAGQEGWLKSKSIKHGQNIYHMKTFRYDRQGNVIAENIYGNLSGEKPTTFIIEEKKNTDQYTIEYNYSSDGRNLLLEKRTPEGWIIRYHYLPKTSLCTQVLQIYNGKIQERKFNTYDDNGQLKLSIEDDGSKENESDLTDITYRRFTVIEPVSDLEKVYVGKPQQIREFYRNQDGTIIQLSRTEYTYDDQGNQIRQRVHDGESTFLYQTEKKYDSHGRLIKEIDPVGRTTFYAYDESGNKIKEKLKGSGKTSVFFYDLANRLVKKEEIHINGNIFTTSYSYNALSQLISETDIYGNTTFYSYDRLGRQIECTKPAILDINDRPIQPTTTQEYNILGQAVKKIDESGLITHYSYNAYGSPTKIVYPDKTRERFSYYLNGWLKQKWSANGTSLHYTYDSKGQVIKKTWLDEKEFILKEEEYGYKGPLIIWIKDSMGLITRYEYDGAGRKITEIVDQLKITKYKYDGLDRLIEIFRPLHPHTDEGQHEIYAYDGLDRMISKTLQDSVGNIFSHESYEYDIQGNNIKTITLHSDRLAAISSSHYNSDGTLAWKENAVGNRTEWNYHRDLLNGLGQNVLCRTITDPMGRMTKEEEDALGRVVKREVYIAEKQLSCNDFRYDTEGRLVKHRAQVIKDGRFLREYAIQFGYTSRGYLEYETEIPANKTTRYTYNEMGNIIKKQKPDGIDLIYSYDSLERLKTVNATDESISYCFHYDLHDNPIEIHDLAQKRVQKRTYDLFDRLIQEELTSGLTIKYAYDAFDRMTLMILPDSSYVTYEYDAFHLKKIQRFKASGEHDYSCECESYDLNGKLLQGISPAGSILKNYDPLGRLTGIEAPFWKSYQEQFDDAGNLLTFKQIDPTGEHKESFAYDPLNHLISEQTIQTNQFRYDSLGNCLKKNSRLIGVNELNQVICDSCSAYTYDQNGNLIAQTSPPATYFYDAKDRLIRCIQEGYQTEFLYDSFGRCLEIVDSTGKKQLIHQGEKEIGSMLNGKLHEFRLMHPFSHNEETYAMELQGEAYFPLQDFRNNVCALQRRDGTCAQWQRYTAFGEESIQGDQSLINPWRFANRRQVGGLSMFKHRFYHPQLRRWLTTDPLRFKDGLNLYAYVHNQPFFYTDPDGQFAFAIPFTITIVEISLGAAAIGSSPVWLPALGATLAVSLVSYGCYQTLSYMDNKFNNVPVEEQAEKKFNDIEKANQDYNKKRPLVRTEPRNLEEQLTLEEAKGGAGKEIMKDKPMYDPKYPKEDWIKVQHDHANPVTGVTEINIHYWENRHTNEREGFKFKNN